MNLKNKHTKQTKDYTLAKIIVDLKKKKVNLENVQYNLANFNSMHFKILFYINRLKTGHG